MKSLIKQFLCLLLPTASYAESLYSHAGIARIPGLNPIASGVDNNFLPFDELSAIESRFAKFKIINEAGPASWCTTE